MSGISTEEGFHPTLARERTWRIAFWTVLALSAFLYFGQLGSRALWSEELRWAQIPREMLQKQDFFSPTINGKSYYDKPLGSYWLVLLASVFTGQMDETASRLPCAISGILAVAFTMLIARRFQTDRVAIWSGIILATSHSFVFFSRHASTDVETIAGVLACLWLFLRNEETVQGHWVLFFWILMALTSLTKGLLGFVLPCLICVVYCTSREFEGIRSQTNVVSKLREWIRANEWFFQWQTAVAIPLALVIYLSPFLISAFWFGDVGGLSMVWRENFRRFYDPVNHTGPVYLYFGVIFALMAPWSVFLPVALARSFLERKSPSPVGQSSLFAWCYFLGVFVFFTMASSRRSYYLLPILPSVAWLISGLFSSDRASWKKPVRLLFNLAIGLVILLAMGLVLPVFPGNKVLPDPWNQFPQLPQGWFLIATSLVVCVLLALSLCKPGRSPAFVGVAAFSFLTMFYLFHLYYPWAESFRTQKEFARQARTLVARDGDLLAYYRTREGVFYLAMPGPVREYYTPQSLFDSVAINKTRWVILKKRELPNITRPFKILMEEPSFPWDGAQALSKLALLEFEN